MKSLKKKFNKLITDVNYNIFTKHLRIINPEY